MTNLQRWILIASIFIVPYITTVRYVVNSPDLQNFKTVVLLLPIFTVAIFGVYAFVRVVYGALTVNDCPKAAEELQEQIDEARKDLIAKGFQFR